MLAVAPSESVAISVRRRAWGVESFGAMSWPPAPSSLERSPASAQSPLSHVSRQRRPLAGRLPSSRSIAPPEKETCSPAEKPAPV